MSATVATGETVTQLERIVTPRTSGYTHRPILVLRGGMALDEDGTVRQVESIDWRLEPPSVIVGLDLPAFVADLDKRYTRDPLFQWRAADKGATLAATRVTIHRTIVSQFGWRAARTGKHKIGHWHVCLDAQTFYVNMWTMENHTSATALMTWAIELRQFCRDNNLQVRSTAASIAVQFLRDTRFYPEARRKVPRATNAVAREQLPGNYYRVLVDERSEQTYQALEIDQTRAHHYHAENERLPDANSLMARGDFQRLEDGKDGDCTDRDFSGLYYLRLQYGGGDGLQCPRQYFGRTDNERCDFDVFVWSTELPFLRDSGYRVSRTMASWGSWTRDEGIRKYSRHSQSELDRLSNPWWLKPILLATYGLLAVKPSAPSVVLRTTISTENPVDLITSRELLHGYLVQHTRGNKLEPIVANVLQRGLIEAATRVESIGMAQWLQTNGVKVLQIYADCVIVEDDLSTPLPLIPPPWRIKERLTDYRPLNAQAYVSLEKERLPGISRRDRLKISHGGNKAPAKHYSEALSGRKIKTLEQEKRGLPLRHV